MPDDAWGQAGDAFCRNLLEIYRLEKEAKEKYETGLDTLDDLLKLLKGGFTALADVVGAELVSAVGALASNMVSALTSAASGALNAVLEKLFASILEILLSGPEVLLALIGLPLVEARKYCSNEAGYLSDGRKNIDEVLNILSKWLSGFGGEKYFLKIRNSLPFIEQALIDMSAMMKNLETTKDKSPYFSKAIFNNIVSNLEKAIELTEPESAILSSFGDAKAAEDKKRKFINEGTRKLRQEWYNPKKNAIDQIRADAISGLGDPGSVKEINEAAVEAIDIKWEFQIDNLDREFTVRHQAILLEASYEESKALLDINISNGADSVLSEFTSDMLLLKNSLVDLLKNIKDAYKEYLKCQVFSNATYEAIDRVKKWIRWFIELASTAGGGAAAVANTAFSVASAVTENIRDSFQEDIDKYNQNEISSSEMSVDIVIGNASLKVSNATINGIITESLIKTINLDEVLGDEAVRFDAFRSRLAGIPDFDGTTGVWAVSIAESNFIAGNPYFTLVADIAKLIATAPIKMASPRAEDKESLNKAVLKVNSGFRTLQNHNGVVMSVLHSYDVYKSEKVGAVKRLLDKLGFSYLAYAFAALSVADFAKGVKDGLLSFADQAFDCIKDGKSEMDAETKREMEESLKEKQETSTANSNLEYDQLSMSKRVRDANKERQKANSISMSNFAVTGIKRPQGSGLDGGSTPEDARVDDIRYGDTGSA